MNFFINTGNHGSSIVFDRRKMRVVVKILILGCSFTETDLVKETKCSKSNWSKYLRVSVKRRIQHRS